MSAYALASCEESSHDLIDVRAWFLHAFFFVLGVGLFGQTSTKVPQLAASIASSLSLLVSLIGEEEILNLNGHTLDIKYLDHLLYLVDKFD